MQEWILGLLCVFFYIAPTLGPLVSEPRGLDSWAVCVVKKVVIAHNCTPVSSAISLAVHYTLIPHYRDMAW